MRSSTFVRVLVVLAVGNAVVVLLHLAEVRVGPLGPHAFPSGRLRINRDLGLAEFWGYAQTAFAVALCVVVHLRTRNPMVLAWAGVLTLVVLDDALALHERLGARAALAWDLPAIGGLRPDDLGELLTWAVMGVLALAVLSVGWRGSTPRQRSSTGPLFGGFMALVFFAVVVDMAHQSVSTSGDRLLGIEVNPAMRFVEALGELVSMTAIALAALALLLDTRPDGPPHGPLRERAPA